MRKMLVVSAAVLGLGLATPAFAPADAQDSTTVPPPANGPGAAMNASPIGFLRAAQQDVQRHRGAAADAALSDAETRLLTRAVAPSEAGTPDRSPAVQAIEQARGAVARRDWAAAEQQIATAMQQAQMAGSGSGAAMRAGQAAAMPATAPRPAVAGNPACAGNAPPAACTRPMPAAAGGMTQGTSSIPLGGVLPPNGGLMQPNGGVMPPNVQQ